MPNGRKHLYEFGPFRLSEREGVLWRDGDTLPLTPRAFDLLLALLMGGGQVLTKDELLQIVWSGAKMDESNLPTQIAILRKVVGNGYVETIRRRGYRFAGTITERWEEPDDPARQAETLPSSLAAAPSWPDSVTASGPTSRPTPRWFVWATLAAIVVTVCVIGFIAFRDRGFTPHLPTAGSATGRLFARATSEGGIAREVKLEHVPSELFITPDGRKLYAVEWSSRAITVLDPLSLAVKGTLTLPSAARSVAMTRDGRKLYVGSDVEGIMAVDTEHDRVEERILPTGGPVSGVAVSADAQKLFLAMRPAGLTRISTSTGESKLLSGIACPVSDGIDPDGRELYVSYQCGGPGGRKGHDALEIYDVGSERVLAAISGPPLVGAELSFAPNEAMVLVGGMDACLSPLYDHAGCPFVPSKVFHLFRSTDRKFVKTIAMPVEVSAGVFAPDGKRVVMSGGSLAVFAPLKDMELESFSRPGESYGRVAFTPNGDRAFVPLNPAGLLVLDLMDPACLPTTRGLFDLFSGDGVLDDEQQVESLVREGGVEFAPGLIGKAFHFNGKDSLLRSRMWAACGGCVDSWSESLYVKFLSLQGEMSIFERLRFKTDPEFRLFKAGDNRIVLETGDRSQPRLTVSSSGPVDAGTWYHLAVVSHGGERDLYVNGMPVGRVQLPAVSPNPMGASVEGAYIGATRTRTHFLNGLVDELAFYNRALPPAEIKAMHELTLHRPCSLPRAK